MIRKMQLGKGVYLSSNKFLIKDGDFSVYITSYNEHEQIHEWHSHNHSHLSLLLKGSYTEEIGTKKMIRLPGDMKYIVQGEYHTCYHYANNTVCLNIERELFPGEDFLQHFDLREYKKTLLELKFLLYRVYAEYLKPKPIPTIVNDGLMQELEGLLQGKTIAAEHPEWVQKLKTVLYEECNSSVLSLEYLASQTGVHPVTISKYFRKYFFVTLGEYINRVKVEKAVYFLQETMMPLTEIAYECRFSDQAHFTRTCKKTTGFLPKEFRKML